MAGRIRFGEFELELNSGELQSNGVRTRLQDLPFKLLKALTDRPGEVVTREELIAALWPRGVVVDFDTGLNSAMRKLRAALGDDADTHRYVETLPRRGYRFIQPVEVLPGADPRDPVAPAVNTPAPQPRRFPAARIALVVLVVAIALGATLTHLYRSNALPDAPLPGAPGERSIAVLPFENLGDPADTGFLASGLSESILQRLMLLPSATVIARGSSFSPQARGDDPQALGRLLHARYLLTGSVQRQGTSLRVIATLLESSDGEQVWSARFDRSIGDVFAVQDEIASQVARAMRISLDATAAARMAARGTNNIDAYMEYLQARGLHATLRQSDLLQAEAHYRRSIELDPEFSSAYSALARITVDLRSYRWDHRIDEARRRRAEARRIAEQALSLDKSNADAYLVLSLVATSEGEAAPLVQKALALNPNLAEAHAQQAELDMDAAFAEQPRRADDFFRHIDRALALDPLQPHYLVEKMWGIFTMRTARMAEAEALLEQALRIDPDFFPALTRIGELRWCCQGRMADALPYLERALAIDPASTTTAMLLIQVYTSAGDLAAARELQRGFPNNTEGKAAIDVRQHQWQAAAGILDEQIARSSVATASSINPLVLAMRMRAYESGDFGTMRSMLEENFVPAGSLDGDIAPRMGTFYMGEVMYAETLRAPGEAQRQRMILESVLRAMDRTANEFQRGDFWFPLWRARTLALLGRDQEALAQLEQLLASKRVEVAWEIAVDPVFDRLRKEPRFTAVLQQVDRYRAEQRARIDELRRQGAIPRRG